MGRPKVTFTRNPNPDAAQLAAWRALWRILLTPRSRAGSADRDLEE